MYAQKRIIYLLLISILLQCRLLAITGEQILKNVDNNEVFKTIKYTGVMTIVKGSRRDPKIKTFQAVAHGRNKAFIKFTNPGDRGTKYLKLGDELWVKGTYAERADKISGHLLRESMMGSDFSYEDAMENDKLVEQYDAKLLGEETVESRLCYKLELTAKVKKISYPRRMLWVDKERFITLKAQFFALSGMLLKEMVVLKVKKINNRYFPVKLKMINKQRGNSYTLFEMESIILDEPVSDSIFTKQQLER